MGNVIRVVICSHFSIFGTLETTEESWANWEKGCDLLSF